MQTTASSFRPPASPINLPPSTSSASATTATPASASDPLLELTNLVASMKTRLDELQTNLIDAGRKLREASQTARQKERVYQETSRKLERIRMAV